MSATLGVLVVIHCYRIAESVIILSLATTRRLRER